MISRLRSALLDKFFVKPVPKIEQAAPLPVLVMLGLAFLLGVLGGFGAIVFKGCIAFFHNLFFYGVIDFTFEPNVHMAPSSWGMGVILVPVLGALIVTWITKTLAPEARGHGVPEVLNAIYYRGGKIRPVVVIAKAIASAISIGSGGSVGREGPIIQIGAAFGSVMGQIVRMPVRQRITLVAAGAAAGIAATFNAPIGGLAFAIELLLVSISARTVALVAVSTVSATYIGRLYDGLAPSFDVPKLAMFDDHIVRLYGLLLCVPLGALIGAVAALFIRSIYLAEDGFEKWIKNEYVRHCVGMGFVGVALYLFMQHTGHYYVGGVGYPAVMDMLSGVLADPWFLLCLFVAKLLVTDVTLGSGASGGVFSPALFLGGAMGAAFGNLVALWGPDVGLQPAVYAIAGMAAMVGGTTGAVLTAITMTFEQTRDYAAMLPIILCVAMAHLVRVKLCPESIYTLKLVRRGAYVPQGLQAAVSERANARNLMSTDFQVVDIEAFYEWRGRHKPGDDARYTVIVQGDEVLGIARDELLYLLRDERPDTAIEKTYLSVGAKAQWREIMRDMRTQKAEFALVFAGLGKGKGRDVVGVISAREVMQHAGVAAALME